MHLLESGTDLAVVALWLGHATPATTHQYLAADLAAKRAALARVPEPEGAVTSFQPQDDLIAFLEAL